MNRNEQAPKNYQQVKFIPSFRRCQAPTYNLIDWLLYLEHVYTVDLRLSGL